MQEPIWEKTRFSLWYLNMNSHKGFLRASYSWFYDSIITNMFSTIWHVLFCVLVGPPPWVISIGIEIFCFIFAVSTLLPTNAKFWSYFKAQLFSINQHRSLFPLSIFSLYSYQLNKLLLYKQIALFKTKKTNKQTWEQCFFTVILYSSQQVKHVLTLVSISVPHLTPPNC